MPTLWVQSLLWPCSKGNQLIFLSHINVFLLSSSLSLSEKYKYVIKQNLKTERYYINTVEYKKENIHTKRTAGDINLMKTNRDEIYDKAGAQCTSHRADDIVFSRL